MTGKPRNSLENFRVCYGYTRCFITIFQDFATGVLNVSLRYSNTPLLSLNLWEGLYIKGVQQGRDKIHLSLISPFDSPYELK